MPRLKVMTLHLDSIREDWSARRDRLLLFLQSEEVDVLLLQQVAERPWRLNQAEEIAYLSGYGMSFAACRQIVPWPPVADGLAILSRYPMTNVLSREIISPPGLLGWASRKRRISQRVELSLDGMTVIVYNTRFPLDPDEQVTAAERLWGQVTQEEAILVVVGGNFYTQPQGRAVGFLQGREKVGTLRGALVDAWHTAGVGPSETYPSHTPRERLDYVFYLAEPAVVLQEARVIGRRPVEMSDHAAVLATFLISPPQEHEYPLMDNPVVSLEPTGGGYSRY